MRKICLFIVLITLICLPSAKARIVNVSSLAQLQAAISKALPGDEVIVSNGIYKADSSIVVTVKGTAGKPVVISAQTIGGVEISGNGGFDLEAPSQYVVVKGFKFTHKNGLAKIASGASHCTFTRNLFDQPEFSKGVRAYLTVSGDDCEVSYNTFQNKNSEGQMVSVQGPGGSTMAKRTWIHHNYFCNFVPPGANNCSAIQIGLSGRSMDAAYCLVEHNLFYKTRGENEGAICHKSSNNVIRYNTFREESEELSLRHGNNSEVYGNFFFGNNGLRFSGDNHKIYCNQFVDCKTAICCTNGDGEVAEGSKLTCHDRADGVQVVYNTLVNSGKNFQMPARNNGLGATRITFANNIIQGGDAISINTPGPYANPVWKGNLIYQTTGGDMPAGSYLVADPLLTADANGVYHLRKGSPAIGTGSGDYSYVSFDIDGQARGKALDKGADQFSMDPSSNRPLKVTDVGPNAPE